tara:strand:- start:37 stop:282 length:246 start_codon:yes stop_codon:yes gene_type:complete
MSKITKEYKPFIDNYGEYDQDVSGDLVLVDAEKLDELILGIGGCESDFYEDDEDYKSPWNELPRGTYYILRAINIKKKEVK